MDFDIAEDRGINISGILSFDSENDLITDFVEISEIRTGRYELSIDSDGGADNFQKIAEIWNMNTDISNEQVLYDNNKLIIN